MPDDMNMRVPTPKIEIDMTEGRAHGTAVMESWTIEATWIAANGQLTPTQGMTELRLFPAGELTATDRDRGINSSVLRRVESVIAELNRVYAGLVRTMTEGPDPLMTSDRAMQKIKGETPRSTTHYYRLLLRAIQYRKAAGSKRPIQDVAEGLGLKPETVKTQLRAARKWETAAARDAEAGRDD